MNKEEARQFDKNFIEELIEHYYFRDFLADRTSLNFQDWCNGHIDDISVNFNTEVKVADGATKAVFVLPETGTVIKIPYGDFESDYCKIEYDNYVKAVAAGLEQCFAWCEPLMTVNVKEEDLGIYIMEYVDAEASKIEQEISEEFPDLADSYGDEIGCSECVEEILAAHWDYEIYDAFEEFSGKNHINDLHSGNIGYADRGIVVIDYSGF